MSDANYPTAFASIAAWASRTKVQQGEAKRRFAQYGILRAFAASADLRKALVFKGGNALDFVWQANRSTLDLDFSSLVALDEPMLRARMKPAFEAVERLLGTRYGINSIKRNPPGPDKEFATWQVHVGYALQDDTRNRAEFEAGRSSRAIIEVEISLNEVVCEHTDTAFSEMALQVCSLEDIVAEKLRALLQQVPRNRHRRQDLLDIAVVCERATLDRAKVTDFLLKKASSRGLVATRTSFLDPELRARAGKDYDALAQTARQRFVPYEEALGLLDAFVASLGLPEP